MSEKSGKSRRRREILPERPSGRRPSIPPGHPMKPRISRREKERERRRLEEESSEDGQNSPE